MITKREEKIYARIAELWKEGGESRQVAFKAELLLNDELSEYSLEEILDIIEKDIESYEKNRK